VKISTQELKRKRVVLTSKQNTKLCKRTGTGESRMKIEFFGHFLFNRQIYVTGSWHYTYFLDSKEFTLLAGRFERVLTMGYVYNSQNYWVLGLCPSPGILETRRHNVSETTLLGLLERASLSHWTTTVRFTTAI
jgi:hypothetical protein